MNTNTHDGTCVVRRVQPDDASARWCLSRYFAELEVRFVGGFDRQRNPDPPTDRLTPPHGAFLVAYLGAQPAGCVQLSTAGDGVAEVKRQWVAPEVRGRGIARRLMAAAEQQAREFNVQTLRLDTNGALTEAMALYRATGWVETV